jgi:hypothetical protein
LEFSCPCVKRVVTEVESENKNWSNLIFSASFPKVGFKTMIFVEN